MKFAIIGEPRCGKSTFATKLAKKHGIELLSTGKRALVATDDFMGIPWADVPDAVLARIQDKDSWILEGCQAARVLRRWFKADPENALQLSGVYYFDRPFVPRTPQQSAMGKGIAKVFRDVLPYLKAARVPVHYGVPEEA